MHTIHIDDKQRIVIEKDNGIKWYIKNHAHKYRFLASYDPEVILPLRYGYAIKAYGYLPYSYENLILALNKKVKIDFPFLPCNGLIIDSPPKRFPPEIQEQISAIRAEYKCLIDENSPTKQFFILDYNKEILPRLQVLKENTSWKSPYYFSFNHLPYENLFYIYLGLEHPKPGLSQIEMSRLLRKPS